MAAYFPASATGLSVVTYPVGPNATGTNVAGPNGAANTKGSYTELVSSMGTTTNRIVVTVRTVAPSDMLQVLIDFATGSAGAEVVKIPNLGIDNAECEGTGSITIPWEVRSGSRVAARIQSNSAVIETVNMSLTACAGGGMRGMTSLVNYGANTSDSGGQQVDPGGTTNTKGSYAQVTASTSALMQWAMLDVTSGGDSTPLSVGWCVDVATGAGGAETVLWSDVRCGRRDVQTSAFNYAGRLQGALTYIPASTRIAARASASQNDASARKIDVLILGGVAPSPAGGPWIYYEQQSNQAAA